MITRSQTCKKQKPEYYTPSKEIDFKCNVNKSRKQLSSQKNSNLEIQRNKLENNKSPIVNIHIHMSPVVEKFQTFNEPVVHVHFDELIKQSKVTKNSLKSRNSSNHGEKNFKCFLPVTISTINPVSVNTKDTELLTPKIKSKYQRLVKNRLSRNVESGFECKGNKEMQRSDIVFCKRKLCLDKIDYESKYNLKKAVVVLEDICLKNSCKNSIKLLSRGSGSNILDKETNIRGVEANNGRIKDKESGKFIQIEEIKEETQNSLREEISLMDMPNEINLNNHGVEINMRSEKPSEEDTLELGKISQKDVIDSQEEKLKLTNRFENLFNSSTKKNIVSHKNGNGNEPCRLFSISKCKEMDTRQLSLSGMNGEVYAADPSDSEVTNNCKTSLTSITENCNFSEIMKKIANETVRNEILSYVKQKTSVSNIVENNSKKEKVIEVEEMYDNLIDKQDQSEEKVNQSMENLENCIKETTVDTEKVLELQSFCDVSEEGNTVSEYEKVISEPDFSDTQFFDSDGDKPIKSICESMCKNSYVDHTFKEIFNECNKSETKESPNTNENSLIYKDLEVIQLECIKKEMMKRKIFPDKEVKRKLQKIPKKNKSKADSGQTANKSLLKEKKIKKAKKSPKMKRPKKEVHLDGYIPLKASGPTKFAVAPINKIDPFERHDAKHFKNSVLFGNRIHRFATSKELEIYKIKQKLNKEKYKI